MADPIRPSSFSAHVERYLSQKTRAEGQTPFVSANPYSGAVQRYQAQMGQKTPSSAPMADEVQGTGFVEQLLKFNPVMDSTRTLLEGGVRGALQSGSALATTFGADETAQALQERAAAQPQSPMQDWRQIRTPWQAEQYVLGLLGESLPEMAAIGGAAVGGALAGGPVGGVAAAYGTSTLFHNGRNLQRQDEERGDGERSYGAAFVGALGQAGLDVLLFGVGRVGSVFGTRLIGAAEESAAKAGLAKRASGDALLEGATEFGQQLIEITQANPELARIIINPDPNNPEEMARSEQLVRELVDAAVGGAAGGLTVSGVAQAISTGPTQEQVVEAGDIGALTPEDLGTAPPVLALPAPTPEELAAGQTPPREPTLDEEIDALEWEPDTAFEVPPQTPDTIELPGPETQEQGPNETPVVQGQGVPDGSPIIAVPPENPPTKPLDNTLIKPGMSDGPVPWAGPEIDPVLSGKYAGTIDLISQVSGRPVEELKHDSRIGFFLSDIEFYDGNVSAPFSDFTDFNTIVARLAEFTNFEPEIAMHVMKHLSGVRKQIDSGVPASSAAAAFDLSTLVKEIEAYADIRARMDKVELSDIKLGFFRSGDRPGVLGFYDYVDRAIKLDVSRNDFAVTVGHEIGHAMAHAGYFDTAQGKAVWNTLVEYASTLPDPSWITDNYHKSKWVEEKVVEMIGQYWAVRDSPLAQNRLRLPKSVLRALQNASNFLREVVAWAKSVKKDVMKGRDPLDMPMAKLGPVQTALEEIVSGRLSGTIRAARGEAGLKAGEVSQSFARMAARFGPEMAKRAKETKQYSDYYNTLVNWGWTIIQTAKANTHIKFLQDYTQLANAWYTKKMAWQSRADETLGMWNKLSWNESEGLARFIFDIEQMAYRTPKEISDGVVRKPTNGELQRLIGKHKLTRGAFDVYLKQRKDFDAVLEEIEKAVRKNIMRSMPDNPIGRDIELTFVTNEFAKLKQRPYFPHARFGNYTVVVTNKKGATVYMEAFETKTDRKRALASIKRQFPFDKYNVAQSAIPEEAQVFKGLPPSLLNSIKDRLALSDVQRGALDELLIQMSPAQSFKNHFVRRKNTPGFSKDAIRAYSQYFWHASNHLARIEYGPDMDAAIQEGKQELGKMRRQHDVNSTTRVQIIDYVERHYDSIMNPKPDWAAMRSVGFFWHLGFNLKSALVNLTQVPLVTYPYLAANFNDAKALASLASAYGKIRSAMMKPQGLSAADQKQIELARKYGVVDQSFAMQLAGTAEGSNLLKGKERQAVKQAMIGINQAAGFLFQTAEKLNRYATFMAGVDLARKNPDSKYIQGLLTQYDLEYKNLIGEDKMTPDEALAYLAGKDAVRWTHFEYESWARPRIMEGRKSAFLTFFMYTQNMLWFMQNSPGRGRYLLLLLMTAGIMGMPGAEDLEAIAKAIGRKYFDGWSPEKELRELITELTDVNPDWFLHGISRYGFGTTHLADVTGVPLPAVDLSGSLSMGSPLPVVSPVIQAAAGQGDLDNRISQAAKEGVGASFGIGVSLLEAVAAEEWGSMRQLQKALPAAAGNLSKAYRYWKEGAEQMRGGATLIEYDRNDPQHMVDLVALALGFRNTRSAQAWDHVIAQREADAYWSGRRTHLLMQYDEARRSGDPADRQAVMDAINNFNQHLPFKELSITREVRQRSAAARDRARTNRELRVPDAKMMRGVYREVDRLYPEAERPRNFTEPLPSGR